MPTSVALSPHFESFIQRQIKSGRYNNASEVVPAFAGGPARPGEAAAGGTARRHRGGAGKRPREIG